MISDPASATVNTESLNYQAQFQQRWPRLTQAHVRSLAWLLDAPGLLNVDHARWNAQVAQLPGLTPEVEDWLQTLDNAPEPLIEFLALHPHTRLGHYAENLLAFYFKWRNQLHAHSLQVRSTTTIGEFDFLLTMPNGLEHWEFACKFYLLVKPEGALSNYVGPNLMDNFDEKSRKIMQAQLALGQHAAAQSYLTEPLTAAKALIKGWLFYPANSTPALPEITPQHCRGLWCRVSELTRFGSLNFSELARLEWLAPARVNSTQLITGAELQTKLQQQFALDFRPVLVAQVERVDTESDAFIEVQRVFVVPDNWNED